MIFQRQPILQKAPQTLNSLALRRWPLPIKEIDWGELLQAMCAGGSHMSSWWS